MDDGGFAARLSLAMKLLNISNGALAKAAQADKSLVSRWVRGIATPRGPYLAVITDVIRARVPGFSQLSWDLPLDAFGHLLGGDAPAATTAEVERVTIVEPPPPTRVGATLLSRRSIVGGACAAALLGGGIMVAGRWKTSSGDAPADVAELMQQARSTFQQADEAGVSQSIGLYLQIVKMHPDYADAWAGLSRAYAFQVRRRSGAAAADMANRARDAANRALAIDPDNVSASLALTMLKPRMGSWLEMERALRAILVRHPDDADTLAQFAYTLGEVGRLREMASTLDRAAPSMKGSPDVAYSHAEALWATGRISDADAAITEAVSLFPKHSAIWFTRYKLLAYGNRPEAAAAFVADVEGRPPGIDDQSFEIVATSAKALASRKGDDIDVAMRANLDAAHRGAGYAENAIAFASATGRLDDAFAVAQAYYFGRGFEVVNARFKQQSTFTDRTNRHTYMLFEPPAAAMRGDLRFVRLVDELGLQRYWKAAQVKPDYVTRA